MSDSNHISGQSYEPLRRLLSDEKIEQLRSKIKVRNEVQEVDWNETTVALSELDASGWEPQLIIAIDGDYSKHQINNGFPGAEIGYITVSTVLILVDKLKELEDSRFVDPKKYRETEQPSSMDLMMVGCNTVLDGEQSPKSTMRKFLFEALKYTTKKLEDGSIATIERRTFKESETLLDTYETLLKDKIARSSTSSLKPKCPHDGCDADLKEDYGDYTCDSCGGKLYSTDALRLHELMKPVGTNGEMYGQIKDTLKRLQLIHLLRSFEQKPGAFNALKRIAFFIEGTLAVFSASSWLAKSFRTELERLNQKVKEDFEQDLLIIGIERSGNFVNHFEDIDTKASGEKDNFPTQSAFLLSNDYIKDNIVLNENPDFIYLKDTAFGRKFFYKTKAGFRVVPSIVSYNNYQSEVKTAFPAQYPRLSDCLKLLDKLVSSQYNNSVMPLATAHSEAAIPLNVGKAIFDDLAREMRNNSTAE